MKQIAFYRILTYILVPLAGFLALIDLFALFAALANPSILIAVFMLTCIVIYTFSSLTFLNRGILSNTQCKPSLRDWIRVNAFVSLVFATLSLFQSATFLFKPELLCEAIDATLSSQPDLPANVTPQILASVFTGCLYFMLFLSIILLIHIYVSFRLLKQYKEIFTGNT